MIAWLPPIAIAGGSNDSASGRQWISPWSPGTSSGKHPVEVVAARMNRICSSTLSKKSRASCPSVMNWCTGSMRLSGTASSSSSGSGVPHGGGTPKRCRRNARRQWRSYASSSSRYVSASRCEKRRICSHVRRTFSSERSWRPVAGSTTRDAEKPTSDVPSSKIIPSFCSGKTYRRPSPWRSKSR